MYLVTDIAGKEHQIEADSFTREPGTSTIVFYKKEAKVVQFNQPMSIILTTPPDKLKKARVVK